MFPERFQTGVLPFLLLAYPAMFLFFRGSPYCEPVCFEQTPVAVFELGAVLLGILAIAAIGTAIVHFDSPSNPTRWFLSPSLVTSVVLLGVFALFVIFLALDAMTVYEAIWKPFDLLLSFLLFLPVWALYMLSFPLAILLSIFGFDVPTVGTLAFRGVVIALGFPLSVLWQAFVVSATVDRFHSKRK